MENKTLIPPSKSLSRSFTLVELIIVIIIVGVLAALGITQYSLTVEKSRLAEAKIRIGTMRQLAYEYYLNNGTLATITNADLEVDYTCASTDFYRFMVASKTSTWLNLVAHRCVSGGKPPNASRSYYYYLQYYPGTDESSWHCYYSDDNSSCFGLPSESIWW